MPVQIVRGVERRRDKEVSQSASPDVQKVLKAEEANLSLFYELEVRDKEGRVISSRRERSRSLLRNFALIVRTLLAGNIAGLITHTPFDVSVSITKRDGGTFSFPNLTYCVTETTPEKEAPSVMEAAAMERTDSYGVIVGGGTTPVTKHDYDLESQYKDGINANQLLHGKTTVEDVNGTETDSVWRVIRTFSNESGATITVREIGLAVVCQGNYVLIARDVLSTPEDIPDAASLTVRYVFKVTA